MLVHASICILASCVTMIAACRTNTAKRDIVMVSVEEQKRRSHEAYVECQWKIAHDPYELTGLSCNRTCDTVLCWPDVRANTMTEQPCPSHINGVNVAAVATRRCLADGTWFVNPIFNSTWTNFSACHLSPHRVPQLIVDNIEAIRLMSRIGYGLSLVSLILAIFIMVYFKKLRCPRNTLHVNLFLSFVLRASMSFLKENLLVGELGFPSDVIYDELGQLHFSDNGSTHWPCKLFMTTFHMVLSVNYMWIFIEALYLHMLIFVSVFSENSSIRWYIAFGWLSPLIYVIPWAIVRATLEDVYCWTHNPTSGYMWIVKGPISMTILVNFIFFLNIVKVLFTKMKASHRQDTRLYGSRMWRHAGCRRLTRSTLVLIPLFGVHYVVFLWLPDGLLPDDMNPRAMLAKLYFEMFFTSFQGLLVAVLFCFLNTEVRFEVRKTWERYRMLRDPNWSRPPAHNWNTTTTQSSFIMRTRSSIHSLTERDHCTSCSGRLYAGLNKKTQPEPNNGTAQHKVSGRVKSEDWCNGNGAKHPAPGIPDAKKQQKGVSVTEREPMIATTTES